MAVRALGELDELHRLRRAENAVHHFVIRELSIDVCVSDVLGAAHVIDVDVGRDLGRRHNGPSR
jgi:hypothetical protein